jgi:hypothetical protein
MSSAGLSQLKLRADPLPWLLEDDESCPGVRYLALTQLAGEDPGSRPARAALKASMAQGPVAEILSRQRPDGSWTDKPYGAKYVGSAWSVISLWQLGADPADGRVQKAVEHILESAVAPNGLFTIDGGGVMFIHCLSGNLSAACIALGAGGDPRVSRAVEGMARMVTGEGVSQKAGAGAPRQKALPDELRYYASSAAGPGFKCVANEALPCAWGAAKALLALASAPAAMRTPVVREALDQAVEFLLSRDPAVADYPAATNPSSSWHKFGFPVFYVTDYLTVLEGLALAGLTGDKRAAHALASVIDQQDEQGRWKREYAPRSPVGFDPGRVGQPNKWVTLRALRVLKAATG